MELGHASIGLGGAIVIIGIVIAIFRSPWAGIVVALIGLLLFGGFARSWARIASRSRTV